MRVGFFRRTSAFFIDSAPIIMILALLLNFFVGDLLESRFPDFDGVTAQYQINVDEYYATLETYLADYQADVDLNLADFEAEIITEDEYDANVIALKDTYDADVTALRDQFAINNKDLESVILSNYLNVLFYFIFSYAIISYFYNLITKGQTFGRRMMNIEMVGKITWFTLLLREFLWKTMFWITTMLVGLLLDLIMISFTKNKKTLRDYFSGTQIIFKGTSYPF